MKRSVDRILTTHTGSLPRPRSLLAPLHAKDSGQAFDHATLKDEVRSAVGDVVRRQAGLAIDIVNDGEYSKSSFATYANSRIGGLQVDNRPPRHIGRPTKDSLAFPEVYEEMKVMFAARMQHAGRLPDSHSMICTGPIEYIGHDDVRGDIANLETAVNGLDVTEAFITAISPTNLEMYFKNEYYNTDEEYLAALCEAMNVEYRMIVEAGFVLQIDDPRLITHYNRVPELNMEENRKFVASRVEAVNYSLKGIPEDRVRFHTCYSINVAPRVHDLELRHYVDQMLMVRAQAFSIEAANPRHEHEWRVWSEIKLPRGKILIPGVVSHCVYQVEHPELVADRIERFAGTVGRENVVAGTDCGFATARAGDEVHPDVAWAKLEALTKGAEIATKRLWG